MLFRLLFLILLVGNIPSCLTDSCANTGDCSRGYYICIFFVCSSCTTNIDCSVQHSVRNTCKKGGFDKCVECSTNSDCSGGKVCVTDDNTYLCGTPASSSTSTCSSGQSIFIPNGSGGGSFCCLACENNSDCKYWTGSEGSCSSGICSPAFVSCGEDSHCPSIAASRCTSYVCKPCTEDSHCSRFSATPLCKSGMGTCVQCKAHGDCPSASAARCSSDTCVPCTDDGQCTHLSPLLKCKNPGSSGVCVQCVAHSDCLSTSAAKCTASNICAPCTDSTHCSRFSTTKLCDTSNGQCAECLSDSDCTSASAAKCSSSGSCIPCDDSTQCARFSTTPFCNSGTGECVECNSDEDCLSIEKAECRETTHTCQGCTGSSHCAHFSSTPACKNPGATTGICVECVTDADCPSETAAKCSISINTCIPCTLNTQCAHLTSTPVCKNPGAAGTCVQCVDDSDCPSKSAAKCSSSNVCIPCTDSAQCTRFPGTTLCSNPSGGTCVECIIDSDCPTIALARCSSGTCATCQVNSQCERFSETPMCSSPSGGTCVQCVDHSDCPTEAAAKCSSHVCAPCTASSQCTRFSATPFCSDPMGGTCVECNTDPDCPTIELARCSSHTCTTCIANDQCERFSNTPVCSSPSGGACVQCVSGSDCPTTAAARCLSNTCATCTLNSQCTHLAPNSLCNTTNGECVECLSISDCTGGKICSPSGVCVGCTSSTQCTLNSALFCNTTIGECVECLADADCLSATESHCSLESNICAPCTISSQCEHLPDTPLCNTTFGGICVECNIDSDCSSALTAHCSSTTKTCESCTDSSQCAHFSSTPVCNTTTGACVECLADADCTSTEAPKCSPSSNTCVACYHYQNACYIICPKGTSPNSTDYTCIQNIATCKSASDCLAAEVADKTHPECNGTMCVACSTDADCQEWYNQVEITCNLTSGACVLVVDPIVETLVVVASTVTTSAVVAVNGAVVISTFASAGSASRGFSTLRITKLAALIRYININAPYEAEKLFESFTKAQTFIKTMLVGLFGSEEYNQTMINLPKRFVKFEDSSSFLKNAGMTVPISVAVGFAILICRIGMHKARQKRNRVWMKRFLSLQKILEWNYIFGMIMGSYPDLMLGFGLQMYDLPFSYPTLLSLISFVICVLVTPISILFPLICRFLMSAKIKGRNHNNYHNISRYEVFIADFKENNNETKAYQMIGLLRIQAMIFPLIFWQHSPLAQILFMIVGSIAVNYFHITKVSYKSRYTHFVILANELLLFVSMIGMLLHISFSSSGINNPKLTSALGWIIASTLTAIMVFNAIVSLLGLLKYLWTALKGARKRPEVPPISNPSPDYQRIQCNILLIPPLILPLSIYHKQMKSL